MRSRWAAAVVLLASVLLLTLCFPAPAADRPAPVHPAAQRHQPAEARYDEPAEAVPEAVGTSEAVGKPFPGEGDASLHRPVARPPRASGAAGATGTAHPTADTASAVTAQRRSAPRPCPVGPPQGRSPVDPPPSAAGLQTFRC